MAYTVQLRAGNLSYDMVYDADTQTDYKVKYGIKITPGEPEITYHQPDDGPPVPVRAFDPNRAAVFTLSVYGTNWDDVQNNITPIKRLVDGSNSQSLRYQALGDVDPVYIRLQQDGATNYIDIPVISGYVDDSGSFYTPPAVLNKTAVGVVVVAEIKPYGDMASFELSNDLASSPSFGEDSDGDGLADGWSASGSGGTFVIDTTSYVIGGKSQKMTLFSGALDRGIISDTVTASSSSNIVAYIWIRSTSGSDVITVRLQDGSGSAIQSKRFEVDDAGGVSDRSITAVDGTTWYRVSLSGTNANANARIRIIRLAADGSGGAVVFVDGAYMEIGQTTIPVGWGGTKSLQLRNDPTSGNEGRINYFDLHNIPGDAPALIRLKINAGTVSLKKRVHIGQWVGGKYTVADFDGGWVESNDSAWTYGGTWTNGTGTTNNHYKRHTSTGADVAPYFDFSGTKARALLSSPFRVFARMRTSDITSTVSMSAYIGNDDSGVPVSDTASATLSIANSWEWVDLGTINGSGMVPESDLWTSSTPGLSVHLAVSTPNTKTFDIDFIQFMPTAGYIDHTLRDENLDYLTTADLWVDGHAERLLIGNTAEAPAGDLWVAYPGALNRFVFFFIYQFSASSPAVTYSDATLSESFTVTAEITPRARHLIGTV